EDGRYKALVGQNAILPLVGRKIPIVADDYSDPEKGSGAVKITPAHDFNDFEVGRLHKLPLVNVLDAEANLALKDNAAFLAGLAQSVELDATLALHGTDRFAARKQIVERLQAGNLVEKIEPHTHMVPHGDRSNVVIEPYLTDQWYVDAKTMAQPALEAVRSGKTVFVPKNWEKTYFDWMENIQPWCVSRQLWWGHQIPAWYGPDGKYFVAETEAEAAAQAKQQYGKDVPLTRDEDVLDTWFSSALWPFSTLGWPQDTPEVKRYYPTDALVTGFDIIFFWVARMMMMGLHFMREVPFRDVYIHALVRDEKGAKMSKSKGNVIDPLALIDEYSADALRFTLAAMAAQGRDIKLATSRVEGYRNFGTKLWNAARFAEMNAAATVPGFDPKSAKETLNRWIAHETAKAAREVTEAIEGYRFNDAAGAAYRFVWNIYCDWYLELVKPVLTGADGAAKDETRATVAWARDEILKILHPFMPFITEELWAVTAAPSAVIPGRPEGPGPESITAVGGLDSGLAPSARPGMTRENLLALTPWPAYAGLDDALAEAEIGWVVDLVTAVRSLRAEMNIPPATLIPLSLVGVSAQTRARAARWTDFVKRLARLSGIAFADSAPQGAVQLLVRGEVAALPLKGVIDFAAERARLQKELGKADADIQRVDAKLGNEKFVANAPEEIIEGEKEKREEALARKQKIVEALERLKGAE
ncbi:MAG: valine--tRNA ligase, partial [Pseudorhodoplanes sp.]